MLMCCYSGLRRVAVFRLAMALTIFVVGGQVRAQVVLNEIMYNASGGFDDLEFIELFNAGDAPVDLSGWEYSDGIEFSYSTGSVVKPGGFHVIASDARLYEAVYGSAPDGEYSKSLNDKGEKLVLRDMTKRIVEEVKYNDKHPWPMSADGYSSSLERIHPSAPADRAGSWAPSSQSQDYQSRPSGTPGAPNSAALDGVPPEIIRANLPEGLAKPGQSFKTSVTTDGRAVRVELVWQSVTNAQSSEVRRVTMESPDGRTFTGMLKAGDPGTLTRVWVEATNANGHVRRYPHANEVRPASSIFVPDAIEADKLPVFHFIGTTAGIHQEFEEYRDTHARSRGRFGGGPDRGFGGPPERRVDPQLEARKRELLMQLDPRPIQDAWVALTLENISQSQSEMASLRHVFRGVLGESDQLRFQIFTADDLNRLNSDVAPKIENRSDDLVRAVAESTSAEMSQIVRQSLASGHDAGNGAGGPGDLVRAFFNVSGSWVRNTLVADPLPDSGQLNRLAELHTKAIDEQENLIEIIEAPNQDSSLRDHLLRARELMSRLDEDSRKILPPPVQTVAEARERRGAGGRPDGFPGGGFRGQSDNAMALTPTGDSAFFYYDPSSGQKYFSDYVNIVRRKSGYKVRLHKDRPLNNLSTINVLYEPGESTILNESLAYRLYALAGNATVRSGYARIAMNGKPVGYHLWFEQPNGNFFKENKISNDGNLYKVIWQGNSQPSRYTPSGKIPNRMDIVRRYEKKSHEHDGYEDIVNLIVSMEDAADDPDKMWDIISDKFDVDQIINYYAVNLLLSHWDGFFNNYFIYHDTDKSGKWTIYPWDQDSTWALRGGFGDDLYRMPLNYGGYDARPPGAQNDRDGNNRFGGGPFGRGGGPGWWRDGDGISGPILANPQFKERYHKRLLALLNTVFTEDVILPMIQDLESQLVPEVRLRARLNASSASTEDQSVGNLNSTMNSVREHLRLRRQFLLDALENTQ